MFYPRKFERVWGCSEHAAQRNLCERTHYVDDDTLRFHKSRVLACYTTDNGLLFSLIENVALDWDNTERGFRFKTFNVFGDVVGGQDLEHCVRTKAAAVKAMLAYLNSVDAVQITREAGDRHLRALTATIEALSF